MNWTILKVSRAIQKRYKNMPKTDWFLQLFSIKRFLIYKMQALLFLP
jgi:hypothetical protein